MQADVMDRVHALTELPGEVLDSAGDTLAAARKRWRRRRKLTFLALAFTGGAAAVWFLDPVSGPERREQAEKWYRAWAATPQGTLR
ncbi:hypothetical protein [Nocardioides sp.]|uniref:hypothetical protein n=1 Tax=Nocardioides sp. TaxID=35761 RepID=UPI002D8025E3|nr:hypothetical protein [Nocardioides sp.]